MWVDNSAKLTVLVYKRSKRVPGFWYSGLFLDFLPTSNQMITSSGTLKFKKKKKKVSIYNELPLFLCRSHLPSSFFPLAVFGKSVICPADSQIRWNHRRRLCRVVVVHFCPPHNSKHIIARSIRYTVCSQVIGYS